MRHIYLIVVLLLVVFTAGCINKNGITGEVVKNIEDIEIKGSDTLLQLVSNLAEAYSEVNPTVRISVTGGGSGGGIAALINGEIDIADASRPIEEKELKQAEERGIEPLEFIVANDMLSVIVNEDNPVSKLTVEQVSSIYKGHISNWKEVGGKDQKITLYGRQSTSGTYAFFMKEIVKGDYSAKMMNMEGNQAILDAVKQDKTGIGYVGIGYIVDENGNQASGIKVIKIAKDKGSPYVSPLEEESKHSEYPISRSLFQYFAKKPGKNSAIYNFLMFELSNEGQQIVKKSGFVPITAEDKKHNDKLLDKT
ncbi:MAG: PstS family phosphate ABC transporter substrate-binding protein [Nanoarchaeota archaeon]|nr:PstS family phosphate ABC transporter substrate-binding protein [Nanoarchaeota archaeon]MBU1604738.1 PstS family phosphate ABC transporter substrate-binding protein [Nanoarchaeota archaeon]MBU2443693.1 PstS family phosphate ABC transporter substrate-binding protein [Nanoarchaeota archaeon]